jgi:hypothetical protein
VTQPRDFDTIVKTVHTYENATGARLNAQKSKALAIANWTAPATALGTTIKANWDVINKTRAQAKTASGRQLSLAKRLQYAQQYLLAKIWYLAQTLPPLTKHVQKITSVGMWYICRGAPFRVPITTLRRPTDQGGWAMTDIGAKCKTLLFSRIWALSNKGVSLTKALMSYWNLNGPLPNPPLSHWIPTKIAHFR